ncbi:hypothetical protein [Spirochaeta cellobiosiphila]|uniref:hypothetical protein n=1 Tax=Spirochaeta cellobiosiphila TaxID=504483 RepID=UPI0003F75392|nr:hypothetical protein [Spirochaeta cellobiosiphila]
MDKDRYIYEPGELSKTRQNLGNLSNDEAQKMAKKLGGNIGFEKTNSKEFSTVKIHHKNIVDQKAETSQLINKKKNNVHLKKKMSYKERVKTDFYCTYPDHNIKSTPQALMSIFNFMFSDIDNINPGFIKELDRNIFDPLQSLVTATNYMTGTKHKVALQKIRRRPLFDQIFKVIKSWDLEEISKEIEKIQSKPRHVSIGETKDLLIMIYKPIIQLCNLNIDEHLGSAFKRLCEFDLMTHTKNGSEAENVKKNYLIARDELFPIFYKLKKKLYPLLVKLLSNKFQYYNEFFTNYWEEILLFLDLTEDDLVEPQSVIDNFDQLYESKRKETDTKVVIDENTSVFIPSFTFLRSIKLLSILFPNSKIKKNSSDIDFVAYFTNIIEFPKGFELLPPGDPLQIITVLISILENLFLGFRNIDWGSIKNDAGEDIRVQSIINPILTKWHYYNEELLCKEYLYHLHEYCQLIEKGNNDKKRLLKTFGLLQWIKKLYFLPYQDLTTISQKNFKKSSLVEPLYVNINKLKEILSIILLDTEETHANKEVSILNGNEPYDFSLPTTISRRLNSLIPIKLRTNTTLIHITYLIVSLLDELINKKSSPLYKRSDNLLYRTKDSSDYIPSFIIPKVDVKDIQVSTPKSIESMIELIKQSETKDSETSYYTEFAIRERVRKLIHSFHTMEHDFSLIHIYIRGYEYLAETNYSQYENIHSFITLEAQKVLPTNCIKIIKNDLSYLFLLPNTNMEVSDTLAQSLMDHLLKTSTFELPIILSSISYNPLWDVSRTLEMCEDAVDFSQSFSAPVRLHYQPLKNNFTYHDDYSYVPSYEE